MKAWLRRRYYAAAREYVREARLAQMLQGVPIVVHAEHYRARAERRVRVWKWLIEHTGRKPGGSTPARPSND